VIEELDRIPASEGSFALFLKAHYAALGGTLGTQLFAAIHELAPTAAHRRRSGSAFSTAIRPTRTWR